MAEFKVTITCKYCGELMDTDMVYADDVSGIGQVHQVSLAVGTQHKCHEMIKLGIPSIREQKRG